MKAGKTALLLVLALIVAGLVLYVLPVRQSTIAPLVSDAIAVPLTGADDDIAIYLKIENRGGADRLLGARSPEATAVAIAGARSSDGLPIPANSTPSLSSDGAFLRLSGLTGTQDEGRILPLTLVFETAGDIATRARISPPVQDSSASHAMHGMDTREVAEGEAVPRLGIVLLPDGEGWTVHLDLENLTLSADLVDSPHQSGTGHAHLYLDGLKLQRMYTTEAQIGALPSGEHELRVTLNTNDHRTYVHNGEPIMALARVVIR